MNQKELDEFLNCFMTFYLPVYVIWSIATLIMDTIVAGDIYSYRTCDSKGDCFYVNPIYELPQMDYALYNWLKVYGATSVVKLVFCIGTWAIAPLLILIINTYLYLNAMTFDNRLTDYCKDSINTNTSTCGVFINPAQYGQLQILNEIQLFGSVVVVGFVIAFFVICIIVYIFVMAFIATVSYIYNTYSRFSEIFCCNCYKNCCENCLYVFCYGSKPVKSSMNKNSTNKNSINRTTTFTSNNNNNNVSMV